MAGINEVPPGFSETMLLRQYLVRGHRFRHGLVPYDSLPNLLEYALGSSPLNAQIGATHDTLHVGPAAILKQGGQAYLTLAFSRDPNASGVKLTLQTTDDLNGSWEDLDPLWAANQVSIEDNAPLAGLQRIVASDYRPLSGSQPRFLRLQAARAGIIETGFEPAAGYAEGESVVGVNDPAIPGTAAWKNFSSTTPTPSAARRRFVLKKRIHPIPPDSRSI